MSDSLVDAQVKKPKPKAPDWSQSPQEEDVSLEICVPLKLWAQGETPRPKELSVVVKDDEVLIVKHKDVVVLQWRLHEAVHTEVEWRVEDGGTKLVLDLQKKEAQAWPCLLKLPVAPNDKAMLLPEALDALLQSELKPLPAELPKAAQPADGQPKPEGTKDDPDAMLDDALQELESMDQYIKLEMEGSAEERKQIDNALREAQESLDVLKEEDKITQAKQKIAILQQMQNVANKMQELRRELPTLAIFHQVQLLDIRKSRLNHGDAEELETEPFAEDSEKELNEHALFKAGLQAIQQKDLTTGIHFLRLAAIHFNHSTATCVLHRIYSELGLVGKASYFLVQRANHIDYDIQTNLMCGEQFDRGMRHFPPLFALAIYYHQRAAIAGSPHAMVSLAQLFMRGACSAGTTPIAVRDRNKSQQLFTAWINHAVTRGCGAAYYILGNMYLKGEQGYEKSYEDAKYFLELALKNQPALAQSAGATKAALEKLRQELGIPAPQQEVKPVSPLAQMQGSAIVAPVTTAGPLTAPPPKSSGVASKLSMLDQQSGNARAMMEAPKTAASAPSQSGARRRQFWERAATTATAAYCLYSIAFPIRVLLAPQVYAVFQWLIDTLPFLSFLERHDTIM